MDKHLKFDVVWICSNFMLRIHVIFQARTDNSYKKPIYKEKYHTYAFHYILIKKKREQKFSLKISSSSTWNRQSWCFTCISTTTPTIRGINGGKRYHYSKDFGNTLRGLTFMTSESCLLKPIAVAGNPSVTKLTHSSWTWK